MSDLALDWDSTTGLVDFILSDNDLEASDDLEAAVIMSLFTDRRADANDVLPNNSDKVQGFWGDAVPVVQGDKFGSRLWLLGREKDSASIPARAETYSREALQWMLDDKVATAVNAAATTLRPSGKTSWLVLTIQIQKPAGDSVSYRYDYNWAAQAAKAAA